jgi:hypothetical protein
VLHPAVVHLWTVKPLWRPASARSLGVEVDEIAKGLDEEDEAGESARLRKAGRRARRRRARDQVVLHHHEMPRSF